jgi:hypothetical protein
VTADAVEQEGVITCHDSAVWHTAVHSVFHGYVVVHDGSGAGADVQMPYGTNGWRLYPCLPLLTTFC